MLSIIRLGLLHTKTKRHTETESFLLLSWNIKELGNEITLTYFVSSQNPDFDVRLLTKRNDAQFSLACRDVGQTGVKLLPGQMFDQM